MNQSQVAQVDIDKLLKLNAEYLSCDQNSNVARYDEFLAEDFTASLPDFKLYSRKEFLDMIAKPRPFTELTAYDPIVRVMGDHALIHARITYRTLDGALHEGRYTDDYHRVNGEWMCVAAAVIAAPI